MTVQLNHTIVLCRDQHASAAFLTEVLGLPDARRNFHFLVVTLSNGVSLDFMESTAPFSRTHYAFLVGESEFDAILERLRERGVPTFADPRHEQPNEINHDCGGRGVYFADPDGHNLEILTSGDDAR